MKSIAFIDSEISLDGKKILDIGAIMPTGRRFHSASTSEFSSFISHCNYLCGHNIVEHDAKYIGRFFNHNIPLALIDTLYISPLLFPNKPYHALLKDDKLQSEEINNPLNDSIKAMELFYDEINEFEKLSENKKQIYSALLYQFPQFQGFFKYNDFFPSYISDEIIKSEFDGKICINANIAALIKQYPIELAYSLSLIDSEDYHSITPPWVLKNYSKVENIIKLLRSTPCELGCAYCSSRLDVKKELKNIFGYDDFRTYNGEPLQEEAANAAVRGKSLLAVFPTGGGKSITFQLPALMAGKAIHGLTIVISPLQSLMKDQVDNLEEKSIVDAVTVNGMLSPIERANALERVANGMATILYISPEQLRSKTIEKLLMSRNIARFVIDEAHCFSAWGQDFRVDYLYIGDFIRELQKKKGLKVGIPVSCFTATAKQKVISDICDYFKKKLDLDLELYATNATRENLHYTVLYKETEEEKYNTLRSLIEQKDCPTIVYVSRTKKTKNIAEKLTNDGFTAKAFNGKMDSKEKIANQEAFINNEIKIIVATSAFGMGVDKKDVKLVVHYDISDSLENYVQEAGRAGRDQSLQAECYVLFNDNDLDKHFMLLNQTKLSISEIQQVWKAIKDFTKFRPTVSCSALEIARQAGWDESVHEIETRVRTAVAALESAGYVKRGRNTPHIYATSIIPKTMFEASGILEISKIFDDTQKQNAKRIMSSLISSRSISNAGNDEAESRVDYLSDRLGIEKAQLIDTINLMREEGLLADANDMSAYIRCTDTANKSAQILERFSQLEAFMFSKLDPYGVRINLKELNEEALHQGIPFSSVKNIRTVLYYWTIKSYIQKGTHYSDNNIDVIALIEIKKLKDKYFRRIDICRFIVETLYEKCPERTAASGEEVFVQFSLLELLQKYREELKLDMSNAETTSSDIEDALLYLSKIGAVNLEGGFLVSYNGMQLKRLIADNKIRYKVDDYRLLSDFYKQKIQQIHIVGEFANLMVKNYEAALQFVQDYFQMDFKLFIEKYFKGERAKDINRNITPEKYNQLFGSLSDIQTTIISDDESKYIVVAAGPGSGKTRVLVHKLAALLLLDDVKHEQLLMLTFSRAATTEFKKRLIELIGASANYVEIKTFHSYCFDLLGKIGTLEGSADVVKNAAEMIKNSNVELGQITKTVVVIDEAQDMDENEFALIEALMERNDEMRVIAVGDDDQNIYEFRGSNSKYLESFVTEHTAKEYEMTENYRSKKNVVALANAFVNTLSKRMKTNECVAVDEENGTVKIIKHTSNNIEIPLVNQIAQTYKSGKACVLTNTNEEALKVLGLLSQRGIRAKLIQSTDGFNLYNLAEIRYLLKYIKKRTKTVVISDEIWADAKNQLTSAYNDSSCLEVCLNLMNSFETINKTKYKTDFEEFIKESNYEDFYNYDLNSILVSTIHKAKGREFDNTYIMLNQVSTKTDEDKRKIYVGLTRAKCNLYIHTNCKMFDSLEVPDVEILYDYEEYPTPNELILQLSYKDVVLDFFKDKKENICSVHSGIEMHIDGKFLSAEVNSRTVRLLKLSKTCVERIQILESKGYFPYKAVVRFVVAWKGENDENETAIILPDLYLKKE